MSTVIYPSPIFGPIHSRRLGISLGINLLPAGGKWCNFDCVYCECGFNKDGRTQNSLPVIEEVTKALKQKLEDMKSEGILPDVLTFAGNGEPTLHPDFPAIVEEVIAIRDQMCPAARVSILSNAALIHRKEIRDALRRFDNPILKLDTVSTSYIYKVDRPQGNYDVESQIHFLCEFQGEIIIQTLFMSGMLHGESVDNTGPEFVDAYITALQRIHPRQVMIYTLDRETPAQGLRKAAPEVLDGIADRIRQAGIEVSVSY